MATTWPRIIFHDKEIPSGLPRYKPVSTVSYRHYPKGDESGIKNRIILSVNPNIDPLYLLGENIGHGMDAAGAAGPAGS